MIIASCCTCTQFVVNRQLKSPGVLLQSAMDKTFVENMTCEVGVLNESKNAKT